MKKLAKKLKKDNENGSRVAVLEDLFYDFNRSRADVYKMNFIRGIFFGLGSALGGTVILAIAVWVLSLFVDLPGVGQSIQEFQDALRNTRQH